MKKEAAFRSHLPNGNGISDEMRQLNRCHARNWGSDFDVHGRCPQSGQLLEKVGAPDATGGGHR